MSKRTEQAIEVLEKWGGMDTRIAAAQVVAIIAVAEELERIANILKHGVPVITE